MVKGITCKPCSKKASKKAALAIIMIKGPIHQDVTITTMYTSNTAPKYMEKKLKELKGADNSTIIVWDFNISHSVIERTRKKTN